MNFSKTEELILDRIQRDFPLVEDPFSLMAGEMGMDEGEYISVLQNLKGNGIIRNISGIFNAERLGFASTLVAFKVPDDRIDKAERAINAHPGVSHNYLRDHAYNIWFTLSVDSASKLEPTVRYLAGESGADDFLILRNELLIKIGLMLRFGGSQGGNGRDSKRNAKTENGKSELTEHEKEAVRILQKDLPLERRPFEIVLGDEGLSLKEFLELAKKLKEDGVMRRYSAVLRHHKAGYISNAMTAWRPESQEGFERISEIFSREPSISHLYLRTVYPGKWEYPLFAMIHARSDDELKSVIGRLAQDSGMTDYLVLKSVRELKKERVTYFSKKFIDWDKRARL